MWSQTEDQLLMAAVQRFGTNNWGVVASEVQGRTGKQCRERWAGILNPQLAKGPWTEEEDELLKQLHAQYGNKWALISMHIKGRSTIQLRNRWSWHVRHAQTMSKPGLQQKPMIPPQPGIPIQQSGLHGTPQISANGQTDAEHTQQIPPGMVQQMNIPAMYPQALQPEGVEHSQQIPPGMLQQMNIPTIYPQAIQPDGSIAEHSQQITPGVVQQMNIPTMYTQGMQPQMRPVIIPPGMQEGAFTAKFY